MKMNYEAPVAEVINFASLEQLAATELDLTLEGEMGVGSRNF